MIPYSRDDVNQRLAYDAHRGTSFSPEKRAETHIQDYLDDMAEVITWAEKIASDENRYGLEAALTRYQAGYLKHLHVYLAAHSRILSPMITGPSNFPTRRNEKANNTCDKRREEFLAYCKKARAAMEKQFDPVETGIISNDDPDAIEQLKAKIAKLEAYQETMRAANKIVRSKKLSRDDAITQLTTLSGISPKSATLLFEPDFCGRVGFADYQMTNNNANIHRLKNRVTLLEREQANRQAIQEAQADTPQTTTILGQPCQVVENGDINRLQLLFEGKPPVEVREQLKRHGFRWSPTETAWQRLLNDNSRYVVKQLRG